MFVYNILSDCPSLLFILSLLKVPIRKNKNELSIRVKQLTSKEREKQKKYIHPETYIDNQTNKFTDKNTYTLIYKPKYKQMYSPVACLYHKETYMTVSLNDIRQKKSLCRGNVSE